MATLAGARLFTFRDLGGVAVNEQKFPIVCLRIEPFLALDHSGENNRRLKIQLQWRLPHAKSYK